MLTHTLTTAQLKAFHRTLVTHHTVRLETQVLDMDGRHVESISPRVSDGQVNVDADADVTRSGSLTFVDPHRTLQFDSESPADGVLYIDRMIRCLIVVRVPELDMRVSIPVLTGPLVKFDRSGDQVSIEVQGKESLALSPVWQPLTLNKGMNKIEALETIARDRLGETRIAMPAVRSRLPRDISLARQDIPWKVMQRIARSMDRQLYYDGNGVLRLRRLPERPVFTFTGDVDRPHLTGPVQVSHAVEEIRNVVHVTGGKPKGAKTPVTATAVPGKGHPLSPHNPSFQRGGVPRFLPEFIEDSSIRSKAEAERLADRILRDRLATVLGVTFPSLPVPHLDPLDLVQVQTDGFTANFRLRQFSLPLGTGGDMTVGYIKRVSRPRKRRIR